MIPRSLQIALGVLIAITVALGIFTVRLKRHAEQLQEKAADALPITPPAVGPTSTAILLVANDNDASLIRRNTTLPLPQQPSMRAQAVLRALLTMYMSKNSPHPIGPGSDIRDVYIIGNALAVIDLNAAFADHHRSGILVENLTLASIAQTVAANVPEIRQVRFLVEGRERETLAGHADLLVPFEVTR